MTNPMKRAKYECKYCNFKNRLKTIMWQHVHETHEDECFKFNTNLKYRL